MARCDKIVVGVELLFRKRDGKMPNWGVLLILALAALSAGLLLWIFWPGKGLWSARRRISRAHKVAMEDALKNLYSIHGDREFVDVSDLSRVSGVPLYLLYPAIESLKEKGLVQEGQGGGVRLTDGGVRHALELIRAHRLLEQYLAEEENLPLNKVHELADLREHEVSKDEVERIAEVLGNPTHDPHGAPIPDENGHLEAPVGIPLSEWPIGEQAEVVQIEDEPKALVDQLVAMELTPGSHLEVVHRTPDRMLVESAGRRHVLATSLADKMLVEKAPAELVPLSELNVGEKGVVQEIKESGKMLRRMLDMGLVPGTVVEVARKAPLGDPVEYRVMNSSLSLRNDLASKVLVKPLKEE